MKGRSEGCDGRRWGGADEGKEGKDRERLVIGAPPRPSLPARPPLLSYHSPESAPLLLLADWLTPFAASFTPYATTNHCELTLPLLYSLVCLLSSQPFLLLLLLYNTLALLTDHLTFLAPQIHTFNTNIPLSLHDFSLLQYLPCTRLCPNVELHSTLR